MSLRRRFGSTVLCRFTLVMVLALVAVLAGLPADPVVHAQGQQTFVAGRNVNMVSGTKWPDGDPYLQRQNEPSIAGSTRNPLHLLAGANDYRTVDVPFVNGADETGDAWLGLFKSFDGGQRWQSTLLPGYPQDTSADGLASPLRGYQAGADPVVRAGTNGLFYYAGLVFDRDENGRSAVFVARFIDNNNQEDNYKANPAHTVGDPIKYAGTRIVSRNNGTRFLDKPWIAVDIPRDGRTCRITGPDGSVQRIPAGDVYVAFSSIYEDRLGLRSDILLSRSADCGVTWSAPARLNDAADRINQGASIAIDPRNGTVHVTWRRFSTDAAPGQSDGIMAVRSTDRGGRFSAPDVCRWLDRGRGKKKGLDPERYFEHRRKSRAKAKVKPGRPQDVSDVEEFDQSTSDIDGFLMFRTNAYPSMAIDGDGRIYIAWTERGFTQSPADEARIVMSTSRDGRSWTPPRPVANEDLGHQLMPSLTFGGGRLVLVYYDLREDVSGQFTQLIDDKGAIAAANKRHTMDLRASVGLPGTTPVFAPSVRVSDYLVAFRKTPNGTLVEEQVQFNAPNLPMFKQGTAPFMGDYVDVTVAPAFVPTATGGWAFNTNGGQPVFHAVWTDNRDVRQAGTDVNGDGNPWNDYTAPTQRQAGTPSVFDPTALMPTCAANNTGSRNQNVYTARLSTGLVAGSPGNTKPLSPTVQRAFVVFAQNTSATTKSFRMTIAAQPAGGRASFRQFDSSAAGADLGPLTSLIVTTPARSTAARSVYATSSNPTARIQVDVVEVPYGGTVPAVPLADRIFLNPDIANPDIANPDIANPDIANPDIANAEVYNPDIANPDIANPDIANPDIANPDIANPDIANPDIANPDIANPDIANPDIANPDIANARVANPDIANPDIANPDIANPDIANPDIANPDIANPDIANGSLSDVTWTMTNNGNTTAAFNVNLFLAQQTNKICPAGVDPSTGCIATQLILRKVYNTPVAVDCELKVQSQNVLLANIPNPKFVMPGESLPDQNSAEATNATLWLAPGETARITLRVYDPVKAGNVPVGDSDPSTPTPGGSFIDPIFLPSTKTDLGSVTPVVQQQSVDTEDKNDGSTKPPIVTPLSPPVPSGSSDPAPTPLSLAFVQQPAGAQLNAAIAPAVSVRVLDQYGAVLPNADVALFLATKPALSTAALSGATATTDGSGIATFPALSVNAAGAGYTVAATSGQALPAVSNTFNIGAASAGITLGGLSAVYSGGSHPATATTVPPGLSHSITYDGSLTPPIAVGSYAVVATITDPNYIGSTNGTLVISPASMSTPVVTWPTPAAIAVGTPLSLQFELNAMANVPGTFVYTPAAGTLMNTPGVQTLSVTFTPTDTVNYSAATGTVALQVVGPAPGHILVPGTAGGTANLNCNSYQGWLCIGGPGGTAPVNTGVLLNAGDSVTVTATGQVAPSGVSSGPYGPSGDPSAYYWWDAFLAPSLTQYSLVARIGSGPWQYVGPGPTTLTAGATGELQLAVNETAYDDNRGWFDVVIQVPSAGLFVPGTAGGTLRALTWPGQACPSCDAGGPGGTAPVDSGIVLGLNDTVTVTASGAVIFCNSGCSANPGGAEIGRVENLVPSEHWGAPTASLMARVGTGPAAWWQFVGEGPTTIHAYEAGMLQFAVNDSNYADNGGGWNVSVIQPALPSATVNLSGPFSAVYDTTPKSVTASTAPSGLGVNVKYNGASAATAIGSYLVRASVTGGVYAGVATATFKVASTLAGGGGGGGPYERYCGADIFASGIGVSPPNESLWNAKLLCSDGNHPPNFGNTDTPGYNEANTLMACAPGEVMVGLSGRSGGISWAPAADFVIAVAPKCQLPTGGPVTEPFAAAPGSATGSVFSLDCPPGHAVTGVVGGAGSIVDSIALVCSAIPTGGPLGPGSKPDPDGGTR